MMKAMSSIDAAIKYLFYPFLGLLEFGSWNTLAFSTSQLVGKDAVG